MSDEIAALPDDDLAKATEVTRGRVLLNALANYGNQILAIFVGFFLQRYLIRELGKDQYALWPLANTCIMFLALIRTGIGAGSGRFLAHALAGRRLKEVEQITTSLFASMCAAAIV